MRGHVRAAEAAARAARGERDAEWAAMRNHTAQVEQRLSSEDLQLQGAQQSLRQEQGREEVGCLNPNPNQA